MCGHGKGANIAADYDFRAFFSRHPIQRYWQRRRHRLISEMVADAEEILDVGSGSSYFAATYPGVIPLDCDPDKVLFLRRYNPHALVGDGNHLPFPDNYFRTLVCSEAIEHIASDRVLWECFRVLKPGGYAVIGTPDYGNWRWRVIERIYRHIHPDGYAKDHIREYTRQGLYRFFLEAGVEIEEEHSILGAEWLVKVRKPAQPESPFSSADAQFVMVANKDLPAEEADPFELRVVIPVFNEANKIAGVLDDVVRTIKNRTLKIFVVDDGSRDGSVEILENARRALSGDLTVVTHEERLGMGQTIRDGLNAALETASDRCCIVIIEGHGNGDLGSMEAMCRKIELGADLVIASPCVAEGVSTRSTQHPWPVGKFGNAFLRILFPYPGLSDFRGFMRAYRPGLLRRALASNSDRGFHSYPYAANTALLFHCLLDQPRVCEVPFPCKPSRHNVTVVFRRGAILIGHVALVCSKIGSQLVRTSRKQSPTSIMSAPRTDLCNTSPTQG